MDPRTIANRILTRPLPRNPGPRDLANLLVEAAEAGYAACLQNQSTSQAISIATIVTVRNNSRG